MWTLTPYIWGAAWEFTFLACSMLSVLGPHFIKRGRRGLCSLPPYQSPQSLSHKTKTAPLAICSLLARVHVSLAHLEAISISPLMTCLFMPSPVSYLNICLSYRALRAFLKRYLHEQLWPPEQLAGIRSAWAGPGGKAGHGLPSGCTASTAGTSEDPGPLVLWEERTQQAQTPCSGSAPHSYVALGKACCSLHHSSTAASRHKQCPVW